MQGVEWSGESLLIVMQEVLEIRESAHLSGLPDWSPKHEVSHDKMWISLSHLAQEMYVSR